jgi:hypothetical protein
MNAYEVQVSFYVDAETPEEAGEKVDSLLASESERVKSYSAATTNIILLDENVT